MIKWLAYILPSIGKPPFKEIIMVKYAQAAAGNHFVLTEFGATEGRIRNKYEKSYSHRSQYEKTVPESWIIKGWVKEVPDEK